MEKTTYALLGGRLKLLNTLPRTTEDALWLAAAMPTLPPGSRVVDAGSGNGAAGLALLTRQPQLIVTGVEVDAALTATAQANAQGNYANYQAVTADITSYAAPCPFQAALSNPPFYAEARGHSAATAQRRRARTLHAHMLTAWLVALHRLTETTGQILLITHSHCREEIETFARTHACRATFTPLQSSPDRPAKRLLAHLQKGQTFKVQEAPAILTFTPSLRTKVLTGGQGLS